MKILLLGANGQLGTELGRQLPAVGNLFSYPRSMLDITDHKALNDTVKGIDPDIIVNAAAYTAVDKAENDQALAYAVNADAVKNLARIAGDMNAWLIHYSTDYVFDGKKATPYSEEDATGPINVYGASKRAGENAIEQANCKHVIFRTTWVIGKDGKNFANTILRLAAERKSLNVVDDQRGVPTSPHLISAVTLAAVDAIRSRSPWPAGIYHLAPLGETSWYEVARTLLRLAVKRGLSLSMQTADLNPIKSVDYPTPAGRPLNSRLDTAKLRQQLSFPLPNWEEDFREVADSIIKELQQS